MTRPKLDTIVGVLKWAIRQYGMVGAEGQEHLLDSETAAYIAECVRWRKAFEGMPDVPSGLTDYVVKRVTQNERLRQAWDKGVPREPVETIGERLIIALRDAMKGGDK